MRQSCCEGGSIVERVWLAALGQLHLALKSLDLSPSFQYPLLLFRKVDGRHGGQDRVEGKASGGQPPRGTSSGAYQRLQMCGDEVQGKQFCLLSRPRAVLSIHQEPGF